MEIGWTELRPRTQCYNVVVDTGMDGPAGYCSTDPKAAPFGIIGLARKVVALQQCSNCHGAETNNQDFFHIANRMPDSHEAKLSPFLMGGSDPKPSEEDINNEKENAVYTAHVSVTWPGSGDCPKAAVPIDRHYNDIARRSLFLAAVLVNDASTLPDLGLSDIIRSYGPNMTH